MKIAIATTTINQPVLLELLRVYGPDVEFFVALDKKSVPPTVLALDERTHFITPDEQAEWKCSELIPFNSIQRRNIATLAAVRWGADLIIHWDDDNVPMNASYFNEFWVRIFNTKYVRVKGEEYTSPDDIWEWQITGLRPFNGLKVSSPNGWFDVGQFLDPVASHRGFPIQVDATRYEVSHVVGAKVGVAAGICLGDPDVGAVTRIARAPVVHRVSQLLESGIVVDPKTQTVFNSQNTAFIRELAPAMFMMPGVGRHDDIYASLICQRVMRERGLHVHFGRPFVWQQRNPHNLMRDLRQEIDGMENVEQLAKYLAYNVFVVAGASILDELRAIYQGFDELPHSFGIVPPQLVVAALAFLDDIEGVM